MCTEKQNKTKMDRSQKMFFYCRCFTLLYSAGHMIRTSDTLFSVSSLTSVKSFVFHKDFLTCWYFALFRFIFCHLSGSGSQGQEFEQRDPDILLGNWVSFSVISCALVSFGDNRKHMANVNRS